MNGTTSIDEASPPAVGIKLRESALFLSDAQHRRARAAFRRFWVESGSQTNAARLLGVSQQQFSAVFTGRVSLGMVALLSVRLGVLVRDIISDR
jgi:hypothetical protein